MKTDITFESGGRVTLRIQTGEEVLKGSRPIYKEKDILGQLANE